MKFCPLFNRSFLSSSTITAHSVKRSVYEGWEGEGGAGSLLDSLEGFFFFPLGYWCPVLVPVECSQSHPMKYIVLGPLAKDHNLHLGLYT